MASAAEQPGTGRRRTLSDELVEQLTDSIRQGFVRPGEKLPSEGELLEEYAVSRTVVREAMSRLRTAGLVETQRGRGSYVLAEPNATPFDVASNEVRTLDDATDLVEFRMAVEMEASALAARRRTKRDLAAIYAAYEDLRESAGRPDRTMQADLAFHLAIATAAHNHYFVELLRSFGTGLMVMPGVRLADSESDPATRHLELIIREHEAIYAAIARSDGDAARAAVRVHLSNTRVRLNGSAPDSARVR